MTLKPILLHFKFDNFLTLSHEPGDEYSLPRKTGRNNSNWRPKIWPGGRDQEDENENSGISVKLISILNGGCWEGVSFTMRNAVGKVHSYLVGVKDSRGCFTFYKNYQGSSTVLKRSDILNKASEILVNDALIIDVEIQLKGNSKFEPSNPALKNMLALLESEEHSDVKFKVDEEIIPAHSLILKMNAPILANFCVTKEEESIIPINKTNSKVFRHILRYAYGGKAPSTNEVLEGGKDIIDASDLYGIVGLKVAVEHILVDQRVIHLNNVVEWLMYAEARTCPLLKEYAMTYFTGRVKDILAHESYQILKELPDLMKELMLEVSKEYSKDYFDKNPHDANNNTVDQLRELLDEKGLDFDGTKEILVSRLQHANQSEGESESKRQGTE